MLGPNCAQLDELRLPAGVELTITPLPELTPTSGAEQLRKVLGRMLASLPPAEASLASLPAVPSAPACRYVRQRSILGPPPRLATCSAAPVPAARSGIACETSITLMPAATLSQAGWDGPACLVTTWARQQETWSMVTASLEWDTVSARPDGPGQDLDAAAGGGEVVRR